MATIAVSVIGILLSFWFGMHELRHTVLEVVWAILAAQLGAVVSLPVTLYIQRSPKLKFLAKGVFRSWVILSGLYLAILLGVCPWLRDLRSLAWMFVPTFMGVGAVLLIYGPIHDRVIARR